MTSEIPWVTPQDHPDVIQKLKLETEKDPDPITALMMRSGLRDTFSIKRDRLRDKKCHAFLLIQPSLSED